ncbi:TonB-dependent receptor family protein [Komagataeibacter medellinensis]|uniref:TonB-dependent outer membrane siderophore receptor n=1 Tax=Komagataeibacter medellinensis (strain NBRC 3288 / BCRC 11682 / LMG 1693 / Kondo 51) TaxID=634177 RepID=G2I7I4_KOMMN|nr:TonB-dependent receptor [Komagataeibacter medellinensis]BAK84081.1 TonB-dependent outer membrane siderophore receptor [Komagataeibacter medellinensis NBRC 3288]
MLIRYVKNNRTGIIYISVFIIFSFNLETSHAEDEKNINENKHDTVENIHVSRKRLTSIEVAKENLRKVPGGTSFIDAKDILKGRNATNADALAYQPGVFAQSTNGGDSIRISIRGSGIQTGVNYVRSGMTFLFDGIPLTTPTGTIYELWEPLGTRYTEVYRGGNGFDFGALQLGGAINYVTNTGYDSRLYQARVEAGSFGYIKEQISSGKVIGKSDYYISVTNSYGAGYQQNTKSTSFGVNFNYGYKFNDRIDNRIFFRYRQVDNGYPGYLTRAQIAADPRQAEVGFTGTQTVKPGTKFLADRLTIKIDDKSKIIIGFAYLDSPMHHENGPIANIFNYKFATGTIDYTRTDYLYDHKSDTNFGIYTTSDLSAQESDMVRIPSQVATNPAMGATVRHANFIGTENYFHLSNTTEVFHNFYITAAGALAFIQKGGSLTYPTQDTLHQSSVNFAPRGGFRYVITPSLQIYGNVTRSLQPANEWQLLNGATYSASGVEPYASGPAANLNGSWDNMHMQRATTFEFGISGKIFNTNWTAGYYHSSVKNELLSVMTAQSAKYMTSNYNNASPTTHQGLEFGSDTTLWHHGKNKIKLIQSYTYSDFRYNHDVMFRHNYLPGIPKHFYQGTIHLDLANGIYAAFSTQVSSSVYASYDNQAKAAPYHIFNVTFGYKFPGKNKDIDVYISGNNLTNTHYASAVIPAYTATNHDAAAETPGAGAGVFAGVDFGMN